MSDFKPPKPNKALISLAKFTLPFYLKFVERLSFKFSESEDRPANFLKGKNVVIVINHSDRQDPLLLIALAKYMHEDFFCIVARESFDWANGILGWLFQRLGCFSVDRGSTDFKSIHTTKNILADSDKTLVVFPEGEVTGDDHHVHEISPALMNVFLNTQKKIAEDDSTKSLWVLPIGVSYRLKTELNASVDKTLKKVEQELGIQREHRSDAPARALHAVDSLLKKYSEQYEFELPRQHPQHKQVSLLARHICGRVADGLNVEKDDELPTEQFFYFLRSEMLKPEIADSGFKPELLTEWTNDLNRTERLLILQRVLNQKLSAIQVCRITDFLESEIFGRMTAKGTQCASVFFGNPIEVLPFLDDYESDKSVAVEQLREAVRSGLQTALDSSRDRLSLCGKHVSDADFTGSVAPGQTVHATRMGGGAT